MYFEVDRYYLLTHGRSLSLVSHGDEGDGRLRKLDGPGGTAGGG